MIIQGTNQLTATDSSLHLTLTSPVPVQVYPAMPAFLSIAAGSPQSATVGMAYNTQLSALVTDSYGNSVSVPVTFSAPVTGSSGTFANGTTTVTATTDPLTGIANATTFTANDAAGSFTITATVHIGATLSFSTSFQGTNLAGAPASLTPRSSTSESTPVGTTYAPPRVLVVDASGNPVSSTSVTFTAASGGNGITAAFAGNAASVSVPTNASGLAVAPTLTAGHGAGAFMVVATVAGSASPISFYLTNTAGAAASITVAGGGSQNILNGSPFGTHLEVLVADIYGNPVANAAVTFVAPGGGASGVFSARTTVPTNALGIGTAPSFTANKVQGSYTVSATTAGVANSASFSLTNLAGPAAKVTVLAGTGQKATVGQRFATSLQVLVTDASNNPLNGIAVTFKTPTSGASAAFTGSSVVTTNASGIATAPTLTANTKAGAYTVSATVTGLSSASFALTNLPGTPVKLTAAAGTPQTVAHGTNFATALQVAVTDQYGNRVSGVTVTFTVRPNAASGAAATFPTTPTSKATAVTSSLGVAIAPTLRANSKKGTFTVLATISGSTSSALFTLTNS